MKEKEIKKNIEEDVPIATEILRDYKENNKKLMGINRKLYHIIAVLLIMVAIETTYIIIFWESLHPEMGVIREEQNK